MTSLLVLYDIKRKIRIRKARIRCQLGIYGDLLFLYFLEALYRLSLRLTYNNTVIDKVEILLAFEVFILSSIVKEAATNPDASGRRKAERKDFLWALYSG